MAARKLDDETTRKVIADHNAKMDAEIEAMRNLLREEGICCVCLEVFAPGQKVHILDPCRHILHEACSNKHFYGGPEVRGDCPYCRRTITFSNYELDDRDFAVAPPAPEPPLPIAPSASSSSSTNAPSPPPPPPPQ